VLRFQRNLERSMITESQRKRKRFGKPFESQLREDPSGCTEWTGRTDKDGYGVRGARIGERRAHRFAYASAHGDIPVGMIVRHTCDNPLCCNPSHLELGSHHENIEDKVVRSRQAIGSRIHTTKLTPETVLLVRADSSGGMRQVDIAERYGIDQTTVSQIVRRKTWKHI
jgi:hypothetical protein